MVKCYWLLIHVPWSLVQRSGRAMASEKKLSCCSSSSARTRVRSSATWLTIVFGVWGTETTTSGKCCVMISTFHFYVLIRFKVFEVGRDSECRSKIYIYVSKLCARMLPELRIRIQWIRIRIRIQHLKLIQIQGMFVDHFCAPGSGSRLRIRIRIRIQGPHWIRIQSGYGSGFTALDAADSWRHSHLPSGVSLMRSSPGAIRRLALIPFPRSAVSNTSATRHSLLWRLQLFFCSQPKHVSTLCFFRTLKDLSSYGWGSSFKLIRIRLFMRIRILPLRLQSLTNYLFERYFFLTFYFSNIINVKNLSRRYSFVDFNCFYFSYLNSYVNNIGRCRVSDPDRIRIQSGQWIRIRIRNPDPGGQKWPTKVGKKIV